MLQGTGHVADFEKEAPRMESLDTEALGFANAEVMQVLCEIYSEDVCDLLPPALHPTLPPVVCWSIYRFPETEWGEVRLAQTRIECRSGLRPRGLLVSAVTDNPAAGRALAARFGFRIRDGVVGLRRSYDEIRAEVEIDGELVLDVGLRDPDRLDAGTIQFVSSIHPATTPRGFRLVQVDTRHDIERAERGDPIVEEFEADAWGDERIEPAYPISAIFGVGEVTLPKLRYVCRPDVMAFEGTEALF